MAGFAEHAKTPGFAALASQNHGFAKFLDGSHTFQREVVGFAPGLKKYEAQQAAKEAGKAKAPKKRPHRSERPERDTYPFPAMTVGRKVDMREAQAWRDYPRALEMRNHGWKLGSFIALKNVTCVYFSPEEMNNALTERYKDAAQSPDNRRRQAITRRMREEISDELRVQQRTHDEYIKYTVIHVDEAELRRRATDWDLDSDERNESARLYNQLSGSTYEAYDKQDLAEQILLTKPNRLWTPREFEVGAVDGLGPKQFGFNLVDHDRVMVTERSAMVNRFVDRFGFNRKHFSDDWSPQVAFVDLAQAGVDGLQKRMAGAPLELPLRQPGVYLDT